MLINAHSKEDTEAHNRHQNTVLSLSLFYHVLNNFQLLRFSQNTQHIVDSYHSGIFYCSVTDQLPCKKISCNTFDMCIVNYFSECVLPYVDYKFWIHKMPCHTECTGMDCLVDVSACVGSTSFLYGIAYCIPDSRIFLQYGFSYAALNFHGH